MENNVLKRSIEIGRRNMIQLVAFMGYVGGG